MYRLVLIILLLTSPLIAEDKARVQFQISVPDTTPKDIQLAIGANINGWDPSKGRYEFVRAGNGVWYGTLPELKAGTMLVYKVTRGDWDSVEVNEDGSDMVDRRYRVHKGDQTVAITVEGWRDQEDIPKPESSAIVPIIHKTVELPTFPGPRDVYIYLPSDYSTSTKHYPVIYMTDGANLFDQTVGSTAEWGMDELMEQYVSEGSELTSIVVGIDHAGPNRTYEYSPWDFSWRVLGTGKGKGSEFADWLAKTFKPMIDKEYRTKPGREHTTIMGSSMGGLISCYVAIKYQDIFSKAACYSPAFLKNLVGDNLLTFISKTKRKLPMKIHMDMGDGELELFGKDILNEMEEVNAALLKAGFSKEEIRYQMIPEGIHHEGDWRKRTPEILSWLNKE